MTSDFRNQIEAAFANTTFSSSIRQPYASELTYGRHNGPAPADAKLAAVVAVLYPTADGWSLPLILRPETLPTHAGQVSLPGGLVKPGEAPRDAALRELSEELGVSQREVEVLGHLSETYIFASNHVVVPWVSIASSRPSWKPCPDEVDELIELPVDVLTSDEGLDCYERTVRGVAFRSPYFAAGEHKVWGATCIILGELAALLRSAR